ncbi:MAG: protease modulator HflC, partial [Roseinatronobacter sp.]
VYADAYNLDPEFFAFSRSMQSYESALRGDNASMVLRPDSEFFSFLRTDGIEQGVLDTVREAAERLADDPDMIRQRAPEADPEEPDAVRELEAIIGN